MRDFVSESELNEVLRVDDGPSGDAASIPTANVIDSILSNLLGARELLSDGKRWFKGAYCAGDASGDAYCMLGALLLASGHNPRVAEDDTSALPIQGEMAELRAQLPDGRKSLRVYNDSDFTTHADVLSLFDRAIASRRAHLGG